MQQQQGFRMAGSPVVSLPQSPEVATPTKAKRAFTFFFFKKISIRKLSHYTTVTIGLADSKLPVFCFKVSLALYHNFKKSF